MLNPIALCEEVAEAFCRIFLMFTGIFIYISSLSFDLIILRWDCFSLLCRCSYYGSCADYVRSKLQSSLKALADRFPNGCKWGIDAHKGVFQNRIFGGTEIGSCLSNLEVSRGGDGSTVNVAGYEKKSGTFRSGWGPSWRCVWPMKADSTSAGPAGKNSVDYVAGDGSSYCDDEGDDAHSHRVIILSRQFYFSSWSRRQHV